MPSWPSTLPQAPDISGYTEQPQSQVIRTAMDAGPAKTRRRFTAASRNISVRYVLSAAQQAIFKAWWESDIAAGALPFDWPHDGQTVSARIVGEYQLSPLSDQIWQLSLQIEVLP